MHTNEEGMKSFYETVDRVQVYTTGNDPTKHPFYELLMEFIKRRDLENKKCLEIGSSKGLFQDLVDDYTGVDIAQSLASFYHKKFILVAGARLAFPDEYFDAVFTYATHEHIPDLESALSEIIRVLKPGGVCLFAPAWHTRPWFAGGYQVRRFGDLNWKEKLVKVSIPLRDFFLVRWPRIFMRRLLRLLVFIASGGKPGPLHYKKLKANYETYWHADSDACNSLDPFDVILWFNSRKFICHGYESLGKALFVRTFSLELQKPL